jgi:hypothetical protein
MDEAYRGYAPSDQLKAQLLTQRAELQAQAVAAYPAAAAIWASANTARPLPPVGTFDYTGSAPWMPWIPAQEYPQGPEGKAVQAYIGAEPYYYPSPGPGGFNFGGFSHFRIGGQDFAQTGEWKSLIAGAGGDPDAEYLSGYMQSPRPGANGQDYMRVLYIRSGSFWRPIVAMPAHRDSAWIEFREFAFKPALAFALAFGVAPWLASQIGPAIVGPTFAAANPALTTAIGQTVLQTALNGGDIAATLKAQAAAFAGGVANAQLSALSDSPLLGKVSGAALTTALQGGDVQMSVAQSLIGTGLKNLGDYLQAPAALDMPAPVVDTSPIPNGATDMAFANADYFDPVYTEDASAPLDPSVFDAQPAIDSWAQFDWTTTPQGDWTDYPSFDPNGGSVVSNVPNSTQTPSSQPSGGWVADLTSFALAAIKVNAAYQQTKAQPRTVTQSGGKTYTPKLDGTVVVRDSATGQTFTQRAQTGVPYVMPDGTTIINNGNGTYDVILPNGQRVTKQYSATASGGSSLMSLLSSVPPVVWGLGAALVMFGLRKRRA